MLFAVWQVQSSVPGVGPELALRACSAVNSGHVPHTVVTKGRCKVCLRPSNRRAIRIQVAATLDFGDTNGRSSRMHLRSMARNYVIQEATLLRLVHNWVKNNPGRGLGVADQNRSSPAWDSIAVAGLSSSLAGLFPTVLYAMYSTITSQRKLAAGIPVRHHSTLKAPQTKKQRQVEEAADAAWRTIQAQQRQDYRDRMQRHRDATNNGRDYKNKTEGKPSTQMEPSDGPTIRLGRARRLVAAAQAAVSVLKEQEIAFVFIPEEQEKAIAATMRACQALAIGQEHLARMEMSVKQADRQHHAAHEAPTYRTASPDRSTGGKPELIRTQRGLH